MRPETLAVRAVNQYRRRDILAYISLRYYLENRATLSDKWIEDVAVHLVNSRSTSGYYQINHFKRIENDSIVHRKLYLPSPNEMLAEAALINKCSAKAEFLPADCVSSYLFSKAKSKKGIFQYYFDPFVQRQKRIRKVCESDSDLKIHITDIQKFYPKISSDIALKVWKSKCDKSKLESKYVELGEKILADQQVASNIYGEGAGLLTGPMFSHMIANLVLDSVDEKMVEFMGEAYFRYVDDVILVGDDTKVREGRSYLKGYLEELGLALHDGEKDLSIQGAEWVSASKTFESPMGNIWRNLIGDMKNYLFLNLDQKDNLQQMFLEQHLHIPILDYSGALIEQTSADRMKMLLETYRGWFRKTVNKPTPEILLKQALYARDYYFTKFLELMSKIEVTSNYERKALISKLKYYTNRLLLLGDDIIWKEVVSAVVFIPELKHQYVVLQAVSSRNVTDLLRYGVDVVQSAAQVLRLQSVPVICELEVLNDVQKQGLGILRLNGIKIQFMFYQLEIPKDNLNKFALGIDIKELMSSDDSYIREISCLRGIENLTRHTQMLDLAFDKDEDMYFDVLSRLKSS